MKISWSVYNKILPNYKKPFSLVAKFFILNLKQKWKWIEKITSGKRKRKKKADAIEQMCGLLIKHVQ